MSNIKCPHCKKESEHEGERLPWDLEEEGEITCPACGKTFTVMPEYRYAGHVPLMPCCHQFEEDCCCSEDEKREAKEGGEG